ncbi:agmatinase, partial [Frankia sp. Cpl3]|nr:agmatinase [Frankia sp. Cpl3]
MFIRSHSNYEESQAVIYGMPMDWTVSFRPGSRFGPGRIREVSIGLEEYSPYLDRLLEEVSYFDAGDIPLPFGNVVGSLDAIRSFVSTVLADGKMPIGLGGEHLVTWPVIQAVYEKYKDLVIIHFDAHTDLRDSYEGYP